MTGPWFALVRPGNVALAMVGVAVGGVAASGLGVHAWPLVLSAAAAGLGVAGANALNDALDAETDRAAHPDRPVARGQVSPRRAAGAGVALMGGAVSLAAWVGFWAVSLSMVLAAFTLAYELSWKARGLLGNVAVSFNAGALFVLGGVAAMAPAVAYEAGVVAATWGHPRMGHVVVMGLLAMGLNLSRELFKDAEDAAHDAARRRTFAVVHGVARARRAAWAVAWVVVAAAFAPWAGQWFGDVYAWTLLPLVAVVAWAPFAGSPGRSQRWLKAGMVLGFLPFLATALL